MTPEGRVLAAVRVELDARGAWHIKTHGSGVGRNGIPDLIGVYRGMGLAWEIKLPNGHPTRLQAYELGLASRAGADARVITSRDEARAALDAIDLRLDGTPT